MHAAQIVRKLSCACFLGLACSLSVVRAQSITADVPVTIKDTGTNYILNNAYLTASISKSTGDLVSLRYHDLELMGYVSGHHAGYWEQNPSGADKQLASITIDPTRNEGERAEISIKGWADGQPLNAHQHGPDPGAAEEPRALSHKIGPPPGSHRPPNAGTAGGHQVAGRNPGMIVDMEIRYALGRHDHGLYTYAIFSHPASYPATSIGESRYGFKLSSQVFDWLSVDAQRNARMPTGEDWDNGSDLNMKEARRLTSGIYKGHAEHKYDYCADQFDTPAYGWSSTKHHVGLFFINPSMEYLSSGPDHFELTGHIDDGDGGDPTLLDYWRGSHYGGSVLQIIAGENWTKTVGPIFIYLDSASTPDDMFREAKAQAKLEAAKWPYTWVKNADYPLAAERASVSGQIILRDPGMPNVSLQNLLIGLAYPDSKEQPSPGRVPDTWQNDAKHYEFWVRGSSNGAFHIRNVRPGTYELHAIADGVLGEFAKATVTVTEGQKLDLGRLTWTPVRYGRQLWQIGIPNRSASEFLRGNDHWHWGLYLAYSRLFPSDVHYVVGKSNFHKDWFIYQVPHLTQPDPTGRTPGRETTWTIQFDIPPTTPLPAPGHAVLRLGLSSVSTKAIDIAVNGIHAGTIGDLVYNATINRDGIEGSWVEKDLSFDDTLLHTGHNVMTLTIPGGRPTNGISYDVLRLELAQGN